MSETIDCIDGGALRIAHGETVASHIRGSGVARAQSRRALFDDDSDYAAFERVLRSACAPRLISSSGKKSRSRLMVPTSTGASLPTCFCQMAPRPSKERRDRKKWGGAQSGVLF